MLAFLRSRPTVQRIGCILLLVAAITIAAMLKASPEHLGGPGRVRFIAVLLLVTAVTSLACWRLLRPLHLPPANRWVGDGLLLAGVVLPFLMAFTLGHTEGPAAGSGPAFWKQCGHCLMMGTMMGLPVLGLALLLRRAKVDGASIGALAGVAGGLTAYLTLHIGCTISDPAHVIGGHAGVLLVLGVLAALWRWRERARAAR
jgi:hypothetical protein